MRARVCAGVDREVATGIQRVQAAQCSSLGAGIGGFRGRFAVGRRWGGWLVGSIGAQGLPPDLFSTGKARIQVAMGGRSMGLAQLRLPPIPQPRGAGAQRHEQDQRPQGEAGQARRLGCVRGVGRGGHASSVPKIRRYVSKKNTTVEF